MQRVYNFSAGPSAIDEGVLRKAQHAFVNRRRSGGEIVDSLHVGSLP